VTRSWIEEAEAAYRECVELGKKAGYWQGRAEEAAAKLAIAEGRVRELQDAADGRCDACVSVGAAAERGAIVADIRRHHPNLLWHVDTKRGIRETYADRIERGGHIERAHKFSCESRNGHECDCRGHGGDDE
jgi:hypothetical protein